MICQNCNKDYSPSVYQIHVGMCVDKKTIEVIENGLPTDWKGLLSMAKENGIKVRHLKKADLIEELSSVLNGN